MKPEHAAMLAPFERKITSQEGTSQKWQVEPKDIRLYVEENLLGRRTLEQHEYAVIPKHRPDDEKVEAITTFWHHNEDDALELSKEICQENGVVWLDVETVKTGRKRKHTTTVKEPLVNETGAYHILGIIEGIFSRIGYLSNLSGNEINDIMYDDVLTNLVISMMKNHEKYGITKRNREEIIGFITSTCQLILNSSREGWTGNRFGNTVQEQIVTKQGDESQGMIKKIFG